MTKRPSVAVIGVGAMGEALSSGLLSAGWDPASLTLVVRRPERMNLIKTRLGIEATLDPRSAADREAVVVAVKPRDVDRLLQELVGTIKPEHLLISIVAGVPTATYERALGEIPVIRAMPNTPALVKEAVTGMAGGRFATADHLDLARQVLEAVGSVQVLDEALLDAVTAVSGTGPAYVFLLAEALTEAAIREGLPRDIAESFVKQTVRGAGHLLTETGKGPFELRAQVTSPGGTTAAAVHVLEEGGFRALVEDAVRAAAQRARELGGG